MTNAQDANETGDESENESTCPLCERGHETEVGNVHLSYAGHDWVSMDVCRECQVADIELPADHCCSFCKRRYQKTTLVVKKLPDGSDEATFACGHCRHNIDTRGLYPEETRGASQ